MYGMSHGVAGDEKKGRRIIQQKRMSVVRKRRTESASFFLPAPVMMMMMMIMMIVSCDSCECVCRRERANQRMAAKPTEALEVKMKLFIGRIRIIPSSAAYHPQISPSARAQSS
jgi:hypothetical protein